MLNFYYSKIKNNYNSKIFYFFLYFFIIIVSLSTLVACTSPAPVPERLPVAPPAQLVKIQKRFDGVAGTIQQDFINATLICKGDVGSSGLLIGSKLIGSCTTFMSCMARRAFYASPSGKYDPEELGLEISCYID